MTELHLYDHTDNVLRRMGYAAVYCEDYSVTHGRCLQDRPGVLHAAVDRREHVISWIRVIGRRVRTLHALHFHTHGNVGYIHLPNGGITIANVETLQPACSQFLSMPAEVHFHGCNVAEGDNGRAFLVAAGRAMLGHGGGRMTASDSKTLSVPGLGQRLPFWASRIVAEVDRGGTVVVHYPSE